jgi:NAD(P)H-dependent flavin oxidoreductase YrpB (nitropropane dioxygenase family)
MPPPDRLLDTLSITRPVVQAPIGSLATPELAAGVSEAGGLGTLALTWTTPDEAQQRIRRLKASTRRAFAINVVLSFAIDDVLEVALHEGVPIVSTFWGDAGAVNHRIHSAGALHVHTIGSVAEAIEAVNQGVDVVVAQGWEAGGHVRGEIATMALVPAVVDAVSPVPVIAAGGIGDGRGLAAALALGAEAGWLGTRFVAAEEAATHSHSQRLVLDAKPEDAIHSVCFDGGWPNAPHRTLRNSTLDAWTGADQPVGPQRPGEGDVLATGAASPAHVRYSSAAPTNEMTGDIEAMALYAGQSVGIIHEIQPAARIVREIHETAERILTSRRDRRPSNLP